MIKGNREMGLCLERDVGSRYFFLMQKGQCISIMMNIIQQRASCGFKRERWSSLFDQVGDSGIGLYELQ